MISLDIFQQDAFGFVTVSDAVEKVPYVPNFLAMLGIFEPEPVTTVTVAIEKRDNTLSLIQTSERGAPLDYRNNEKRDIRDFRTVRLAKGEKIRADEIQGLRAMGSETETETVQNRISRSNLRIRDDVELTMEHMRLGAISGIVLDADKSVIRNWYDEWDISAPAVVNFELGTTTTNVRGKCHEITRAMRRNAKGSWTPSTMIHALCGDVFYDTLTNHDRVRDTYLNFQDARELRDNLAFESFRFGNIWFHNYQGTDDFVDENSDGTASVGVDPEGCKFFPVGARGVFKTAFSPAEGFEFANTPGREIYGMVIPDRERNAFVMVEQYVYPLHICTRPEMLRQAIVD